MSSEVQAIALLPTQEFKGNDGHWSTYKVNIGQPAREFELLPWISGSQVWVPNPPTACENLNIMNCDESRGESGSNKSLMTSATWDDRKIWGLSAEPPLFSNITGNFGLDGIELQALTSSKTVGLKEQVIAAYINTSYWIGLLGLSIKETDFTGDNQSHVSPLVSLQQENFIPSRSFGYAAGSSYLRDFGSLVIGGFDSLRRDSSSEITLPIDPVKYLLPVDLWGLRVDNGLTGGSKDLMSGIDNISMVLDSSTAQIWLPEAICDQFVAAFNLTYLDQLGLFVIAPANRDYLLRQNATLSFTVGTGSSSDGSITITVPYAALNFTAYPPNVVNEFPYFPIRKAVNDTFILGRAFLQEAYLTVDWDKSNFTISQVRHTDDDPAVSVIEFTNTTSNNHSAASKHLSSSQSGGVVAGCIVLVLVVLVLGWWLWRRRRMQRQRAAADPTPGSGDQEDADVEAKEPELLSLGSDTQQTWNRLRAGSEELDSNSILPPYTSAELMSTVLHEMDGNGRQETHELSAASAARTSG